MTSPLLMLLPPPAARRPSGSAGGMRGGCGCGCRQGSGRRMHPLAAGLRWSCVTARWAALLRALCCWNMFEDWLSHQGVSWNLGVTAAELIASGAIPPCVCVAIDSAGPYRSYNYLPFPPGTGSGNFRSDAARWPGGGAQEFLGRVQHELLPMLQDRYNLAQEPSRLAFGGGSFAGVTALMAALRLPHVFGGVLVESPSLWTGEGRFLQDLATHSGRLPERLALGCGTREYSATREHERNDVDQLLLNQYHDAARLLQERGLRGPSRFMFWVDEGAGHHEGAWRWRLSGALRFLSQGWWDS
ncbi:Alpha/Beta hydrolase protein [Scenedesmus sp. NREL 46B-D3]|nr:Alpha/Beta hydrolase protein [Scenedesmus sp. NREL 46B-D3]